MQRKNALIFLSIFLLALLPLLLKVASPFFTSFTLASILAILLSPVEGWLRGRVRRAGVASFLTTFAAISLLIITVTIAGIMITRELAYAHNALSQRSMGEGGWFSLATHTADRAIDALAKRIPLDKEAIREELFNRMKAASAYLLRNIGVAAGSVTSAVITFFLVTIFLYFLLRYGKDWINWVVAFAPLDSFTSSRLLKTMQTSVMANLSGMIVVALAQGLLLCLGFWIIGFRSPFLWGAIGGLASIIPIVGTWIIWVPVVLGYLLAGVYWKAAFLGLWGLLIVGSADNVLRPLVIGAHQDQHPVLIAMAAIGGTYAFGPLGLLLGPLLVSLAAALLQEIQQIAAQSGKESG
jgi:predicted PurR-regulated permease PerM